jgi:hypothetical protein
LGYIVGLELSRYAGRSFEGELMTALKELKPWKPSPSQRRAKALLHKSVDDNLVRTLKPDDTELVRYLAPTPIALFRVWVKEQKEFWPWLLTPLECDEKVYHAKDLAYEFLVEVLEMKTKNEDKSLNSEIFRAKMKAAEFLLAKGHGPAVTVNNMQANVPNGTLPPASIPRGLRGKDAKMITGQIARLEAATDEGIVDAIPDEDDI